MQFPNSLCAHGFPALALRRIRDTKYSFPWFGDRQKRHVFKSAIQVYTGSENSITASKPMLIETPGPSESGKLWRMVFREPCVKHFRQAICPKQLIRAFAHVAQIGRNCFRNLFETKWSFAYIIFSRHWSLNQTGRQGCFNGFPDPPFSSTKISAQRCITTPILPRHFTRSALSSHLSKSD
jgi:hypothetical protein